MKGFLLLGLFFLSFYLFSDAQTRIEVSNDSIILGPHKGFPLSYKGETIKRKQLGILFSDNPAAMTALNIAKENQTFGMVFSFAGSIMIGWTLGRAMGGGHPNWLVTGAGGLCFIIGIPLASAARKRTLEAVDIYHEGLYHSEANGLKLNFSSTPNGLGLVLTF